MPGFSHVALLGRLTRDPELRYTPEGTALCRLSVAVNHPFTRKDGQRTESVAFVDVTAWNRQAETCAEFLRKGRLVLVSGRLSQDRWEDPKTGQKRSKLTVVASSVQFLGAGGSKDDEPPAEAASAEPAEEPEAPEAPKSSPPPPTRTSPKFKR